MNQSNLTIKDIGKLFDAEEVPPEILALYERDERKSVQTVVLRYRRRKEELDRLAKLYKYEDDCRRQGYELVAGTDEAGRGPLAGPVAAAAVILPPHFMLPRLNDSKRLSPATRDKLYEKIKAAAVAYNVVLIEPAEIDRTNILLATQKAMHDAIIGLNPAPHMVITDAVRLPMLPMPYWPLVRGDNLSASVAAASILAKVTRDRIMLEYDKLYPAYGFAKHKGYGTEQHLTALAAKGPCPIHRMTFEPIRSMLNEENFRLKYTQLGIFRK